MGGLKRLQRMGAGALTLALLALTACGDPGSEVSAAGNGGTVADGEAPWLILPDLTPLDPDTRQAKDLVTGTTPESAPPEGFPETTYELFESANGELLVQIESESDGAMPQGDALGEPIASVMESEVDLVYSVPYSGPNGEELRLSASLAPTGYLDIAATLNEGTSVTIPMPADGGLGYFAVQGELAWMAFNLDGYFMEIEGPSSLDLEDYTNLVGAAQPVSFELWKQEV